MRRREFIAGLGVAGWPLLVRAQQQRKPVIGSLHILAGDLGLNMSRVFAGVWRRSAFQRAAT
jgi:hypothetical protein